MNTSILDVPKSKGKNGRRKTDTLLDRRCEDDRRKVYDADYFENGGAERRKGKERRQQGERRRRFFRVSKWSSVYVGDRGYESKHSV